MTYFTAIAMQDPSHIFNLHHSSCQCQILNPLSETRDWTCNFMVTSHICFHCAIMGIPQSFYFGEGRVPTTIAGLCPGCSSLNYKVLLTSSVSDLRKTRHTFIKPQTQPFTGFPGPSPRFPPENILDISSFPSLFPFLPFSILYVFGQMPTIHGNHCFNWWSYCREQY